MEKLNVCLINDSFPPAIDGVANAVTNYAQIIARDYGSPTVVTPYYPDADDSVYPFPVVRYPSVDMTKLVGYRAGMPFSPEIATKLEKAHFDIIHSHCPITSTMLARSVRARLDVPLVFTYHTKFDIDIANAIRSKRLQEEAAKILVENISACDEVWTVSNGAGENLRKLGYKGDYIVMPNGVDFPQGRVSEALIDEVTKGYDLPRDVPLFLFVGRMMWYKGIRITLDALKKLSDAEFNFRMVFIGGGTDKKEIVAYSEKLGLAGKVFFTLFPSTFDTNGLVVREAAACGLGSVLVSGSCAAEDTTDGVNSIQIEENADSMAASLEKVCQNPERMKEIGNGAQRDVYISWDTAVKGAVERYAVVIENYKAGQYPKHEKPQDEMFQGIGDLMNLIGTSELRRKEILDTLTGILEGRLPKKEWMNPFDSSVTDAVFRPMKQGMTDWMKEMGSGLSDWYTGVENEARRRGEELKTTIQDGLEEYYDIFL